MLLLAGADGQLCSSNMRLVFVSNGVGVGSLSDRFQRVLDVEGADGVECTMDGDWKLLSDAAGADCVRLVWNGSGMGSLSDRLKKVSGVDGAEGVEGVEGPEDEGGGVCGGVASGSLPLRAICSAVKWDC